MKVKLLCENAKVPLNSGDRDVYLDSGSKIAQILFQDYFTYEFEVVESLEDSDRGESGFGSTGL